MIRAAVLVLAAALSGCASFTSPTNEVRVTEYAGGASAVPWGDAVLGGCRVVQEGQTATRGRYQGERCTVEWGDSLGE